MSESVEILIAFETLRVSRKLRPLSQLRANQISRALSDINEGSPDKDYPNLVAHATRFVELYGKL